MNNPLPSLSRRSFLGAVAGAAAYSLAPGFARAEETTPPNSKFNGVQIGVITYSYRSMPSTAEDLLKYIVESGINGGVELMGEPAEKFARASKYATASGDHTPGYEALKKLYADAGVTINIAKFGNIGDAKMKDEQIEAYFLAAKALGAKGITRELDENAAKRLGPFADKHEIWIGFHNHPQIKPNTYDGDMLSYGKYLGINLDIGHYVAATGESPIPLIEKHHDRITNLHLKDRKKNNGPNMPWGQGDTPIGEVLKFMAKNKFTFPAEVELEYDIPAGSNAIKEVVKCVQFCKDALA
jgi:sugar phosphate isomerase/epimerase